MISAVILAGGEAPAEMQATYGVRARHEITFRGRKMLDIVVDAMSVVSDEVIVVGADAPAGARSARSVPGGRTFFESFKAGLDAATHHHVLMASADLPFLTSASAEDFLRRADHAAALNYAIVSMELAEKAYPGMGRTKLALREGSFTGGNLFLMNRLLLHRAMPKIEQMYQARKSPVKLAQIVGVGTLFAMIRAKIAPQSVSIADFERLISGAMGEMVRAVPTEYPEIAADIDNSGQVAWLKALEKAEG